MKIGVPPFRPFVASIFLFKDTLVAVELSFAVLFSPVPTLFPSHCSTPTEMVFKSRLLQSGFLQTSFL